MWTNFTNQECTIFDSRLDIFKSRYNVQYKHNTNMIQTLFYLKINAEVYIFITNKKMTYWLLYSLILLWLRHYGKYKLNLLNQYITLSALFQPLKNIQRFVKIKKNAGILIFNRVWNTSLKFGAICTKNPLNLYFLSF